MKEDWQGQFGIEYTERNSPDPRTRWLVFKRILKDIDKPDTICEIGCNKGVNLFALKVLYPKAHLYGTEVIPSLRFAEPFYISSVPMYSQLTFTCGVLIHVPASELKEMMQNIIDNSHKYVLAIEYFAPEETEIEYRGKMNMLWKRDYGKLYQDMGLKLISTGDAKEIDNCTYWLFKKNEQGK